MKSFKYLLCLAMAVTLFGQSIAETNISKKPDIEDLGNQQYRIGKIHIDKKNKKFTLSGKVIRHDPPLEFLAVTKGGMKAYESLLELDSNAHEFNLACILIGLDAKNAKPSEVHFDANPVTGDTVKMTITWKTNGKSVTVNAEELLSVTGSGKTKNNWVYTGSLMSREGQYMAEMDGTLIGFVHDPSSVIEHQSGLGLGNYGEINVSKLVPPIDTVVELEVSRQDIH